MSNKLNWDLNANFGEQIGTTVCQWDMRGSLQKDPERCKNYDGDCCANVCRRCPASLSKVNFISWSLFFNWHQKQVPRMRIGYYPKGCGCFTLMFYWWNSAVPITGMASGDSLVKLALSSKDPSPTLFSGLKSSKEKEWFQQWLKGGFLQEVMNSFWHSLLVTNILFHFLLLPVLPQEGTLLQIEYLCFVIFPPPF